MNVGSLFSGIGGFDLGLERAGMRVDWQVELDPHCRAVLARRFPEAERFEDVREVGAESLTPVDLICGGFPCQDLSAAGKGAGLAGARSGLWAELARVVRELRPRYVVVENVPALLTGKGKRWDRAPVGRVLGDLAEAGYDAEWACLSAREFGAPHLRKRVWIVAYFAWDAEAGAAPKSRPERQRARAGCASGRAGELPDSNRDRCTKGVCLGAGAVEPPRPSDALRSGELQAYPRRSLHNADRGRHGSPQEQVRTGRHGALDAGWWATEPDVGRVAHGVPARVDRLAALGNALLPQIAEWIGRRILEYEDAQGRGSMS